MYIIECTDGKVFVGVKDTLAVITEDAGKTQ
jgi:hypothetical protein